MRCHPRCLRFERSSNASTRPLPRLPSIAGASGSQHAVQEGLGILRDQDEWAANLAPDAPSLIADQFHPYVWAAASALWDTGQYRVAVGQEAVSLSAHIAKKAASPLSERELVSQVFSPGGPGPGQVRLHLAGDKSSKTWKSRQDGLHLLAQGAFAGIRNVATHTNDEWPEQVALEHLAVLSVVARWADETEVIPGSEAPRQPYPAGRPAFLLLLLLPGAPGLALGRLNPSVPPAALDCAAEDDAEGEEILVVGQEPVHAVVVHDRETGQEHGNTDEQVRQRARPKHRF